MRFAAFHQIAHLSILDVRGQVILQVTVKKPDNINMSQVGTFEHKITWRLDGCWSPISWKGGREDGLLPPPVGRPLLHEESEQAGGGRKRMELRGEGGEGRKEGEED